MLQPARYGPHLGLCSRARSEKKAEAFTDIAKLDDSVGTNVVHESHISSFHLFMDIIVPLKAVPGE